jgi:hypothetical protein
MGKGTEERSAEAERSQDAQEEDDVGCGSQEDRGCSAGAVGEGKGSKEEGGVEQMSLLGVRGRLSCLKPICAQQEQVQTLKSSDMLEG